MKRCVFSTVASVTYDISRRLSYAQTLFMHPFITRVPVVRPCLAGVTSNHYTQSCWHNLYGLHCGPKRTSSYTFRTRTYYATADPYCSESYAWPRQAASTVRTSCDECSVWENCLKPSTLFAGWQHHSILKAEEYMASSAFCFSKMNKIMFGSFDLENTFKDNAKIYFLGWLNWYFR